MDNYRTIEAKLKSLTPFKGNSMSAWLNEDLQRLDVYSYSTLIARAYRYAGTTLITYFDEGKYSTTTSRHQNLIKKAWGIK